MKRKQLILIAQGKEDVRRKLVITAQKLALTAKEKEEVRRKLVITAEKLAITAKEKEEVRRNLVVTAQKLAITAKEKEDVRRKLVVTAKKLAIIAKKQDIIAKKLKESGINYRRLFETAHDGILILDSETGQITDVNPFLEKLLGYSKAEFLNKKLWEIGVFKNIKASREAFKILQKQGQIRYENLPLEAKSGKPIEVEFVSNSYMVGDKLVIQCNIRDITERKRLDLIKETKRLLNEERQKVGSIADATHELRTPIAIIKGNVDLALRGNSKNPKSAKSALRAINYEVKHLSSILTDLSMVTSKAWELKNRILFEKIDLKSLIGIVLVRCRAVAHKRNITITSGKIVDLSIVGDKMYLEKMLVNLIRNSIIYGNNNGHTQISVNKFKDNIIINITDDGIGISKEDLPHVFQRFYRADKFHSSGGNSIGLGLAIVKWIAEVHGGKVSAKSEKNKGSVFSVSLPINSKSS